MGETRRIPTNAAQATGKDRPRRLLACDRGRRGGEEGGRTVPCNEHHGGDAELLWHLCAEVRGDVRLAARPPGHDRRGPPQRREAYGELGGRVHGHAEAGRADALLLAHFWRDRGPDRDRTRPPRRQPEGRRVRPLRCAIPARKDRDNPAGRGRRYRRRELRLPSRVHRPRQHGRGVAQRHGLGRCRMDTGTSGQLDRTTAPLSDLDNVSQRMVRERRRHLGRQPHG